MKTFSHFAPIFLEYAEGILGFFCNVLGCFTFNYDTITIDRKETNAETVTRTLIAF